MRPGQSHNILDLVLTNEEEVIDTVDIGDPVGKSDHVTLTWVVLLSTPPMSVGEEQLLYYKGDYGAINRDLVGLEWDELFRDRSVEEMWNIFKDVVTRQTRLHVPARKREQQRGRKRLPRYIVRHIGRRKLAYDKYLRYPSTINHNEYKRIRNTVNSMIRKNSDYQRKSTIKGFRSNLKRFYSYMNSLRNVKVNVTTLINDEGEMTSSNVETANLLVRYYREVFTVEDMTHISSVEYVDTGWSDDMVVFDRGLVRVKLMKLKENKSPDPNGIHPMVLKQCADCLAGPLSTIFRKSFENGEVPYDWRRAHISSIFKKGKRTDRTNYRPISLTSVVCKVMETIIRKVLVEFMEKNGLLSAHQHGFRRGRSCLTNLLETFESWSRALDEGYGLDIIYLDYRKAFDSVPHQRLMQQLLGYGISGRLRGWIGTFLLRRTMQVKIREELSETQDVLSGVPQGSVIGPLLFLIYIGELPSLMRSSMKLFADDSKLWCEITKTQDSLSLQGDLDVLMRWSTVWQLCFNIEKCKVMRMGHRLQTQYHMWSCNRYVKLEDVEEE